jgi:hypothetical protein
VIARSIHSESSFATGANVIDSADLSESSGDKACFEAIDVITLILFVLK